MALLGSFSLRQQSTHFLFFEGPAALPIFLLQEFFNVPDLFFKAGHGAL